MSRATISATGRLAGAGTSRTGGRVAVNDGSPLEWTAEPAPTIPMTRPSGGSPPGAARAAAMVRRMTEAANSAYSPTACTNRPRCPELPPDTRPT